MKQLFRRLLSFIFIISFFIIGSSYAFDLKSLLGDMPGGDKGVGLLLSDIEFRKKQRKELENKRDVLRKRAQETIKTINNTLSDIEKNIKKTNEEIRESSGSYEELLKKKQVVLDLRKQNLLNFQDLRKEVDGKISNHIKFIDEIIYYLNNGTKETKESKVRVIFFWKDLDEVKNKIDKLTGEIDSEKSKKERLVKLKAAEKEEIASLKKEADSKSNDKEKLAEERANLYEKEDRIVFTSELKAKSTLLEQDINRLQEKIEVSEFKIEDLSREERHKDDEIFLLKQKLNTLNNKLFRVQEGLIVDVDDVELAKGELEGEIKKDLDEKELIYKEKEIRKVRKDVLEKSISLLDKKLTLIKESGQTKSIEGYLFDSRLLAVKNEQLVVEKEMDFLETRKRYSEIMVEIKRLKARVIEVLQAFSGRKEKIDEWLVEFRSKKRSTEYSKKVLGDKRDEITNAVAAINIATEALQSKAKEIEGEQDKLFKRRRKEYVEIITNIKRSIHALANQKLIGERHNTQISDLLLRQEEVVNQYNFIIKYLETQRLVGVWKRSVKAISFKQFMQSSYELESFFKGLFWDTPTFLSPGAIFKVVKQASWSDFFGILLFFLLLSLFFIVLRIFLVVIQKKIKDWSIATQKQFSDYFIFGLENIIEFLLQHFSLIFTWFFIYIHILFGLTYCKIFVQSYIVSLLYLISIPIFIYLGHCFILRLRMLNQKLEFLFFSQVLQDKITILIKIFLYSTALLLPLRSALLEYFDREVAFSDVSLAAYTLILVIVILFFFNKEDVLRLLSSRNPFIVWLKKQVDRYYYPVFGFCVLLFVLSNPYIGYSNLAWFLAFAMPASIFLLYGLFVVHYLIRKYSLFFFIKEEDEEVVDKFEHAKTYYGFFIAISFIALALVTFVFFVRIWGVEGYTIVELWKSLSEDWVISIGGKGSNEKLGFVELFKLGGFIATGLLISSLINKFILGKIFEIFRTEPGTQNTITKILHYFIIMLVVILGLTAINLSQYALAVGGLLLVGVGFGLQNQIADYLAGVLILLERSIEIGHYVQISDGQRGRVHSISARSTTIKTARNFFITLPNRDIISKPISNWGQGRYPVGAELEVTVAYESDPEFVKQTLLNILKEHSMVLRVPAPIVRFEGFRESSLYFYCRAYISARRVTDMWEVASDVRFSIMKVFKEKKIEIPYPQQVVYFGSKSNGGIPTSNGPIEIKFDNKD